MFDLLYFDDGGNANPYLFMDKYYTQETHAYDLLREFQGTCVPRYYGSYSLHLPVKMD